MERKTKRQKKIKQQNRQMRKIHKKYSLVAHVQLWLERHSKIASFMDGGIILLSIFGIMYVLFGTSLIPKPYQEMSYVLPIIMNFVFWCTHSIKVFLEMVLSIRLQYKDF